MSTRLTDARTLPHGTRLGRYVLGDRIARGGMAEMYLARAHDDADFEKLVVLKLVLPQYKDDAAFLTMLRNEAKVAAALEHPNIASVYGFGVAAGEHFIAMEYVHGRDVGQLLHRAQGPLPLSCALEIVVRACDAAHHAHCSHDARGRKQELVHRDISASNVLVRYDGVTKLVDFGIAKAATHTTATRTGTIKGKVGYMSPEQCLGGAIDRRSDVFSLGVLLYETTTGSRPFIGDSDFAVMNRVIGGEYRPPSKLDPRYPTRLEAVLRRALDPDCEARHETAAQLRDELLSFAATQGLEVSRAELAEWIGVHFEVPPTPAVEASALPGPHRFMGLGRRVLPYVGVASVAGLLGFAYRPTQREDAEATPVMIDQAHAAPRGERRATPPPPTETTPAAQTPSAQQAPTPVVAASETPQADAETPVLTKTRRKRARIRPEAGHSLLPPSMREQ